MFKKLQDTNIRSKIFPKSVHYIIEIWIKSNVLKTLIYIKNYFLSKNYFFQKPMLWIISIQINFPITFHQNKDIATVFIYLVIIHEFKIFYLK